MWLPIIEELQKSHVDHPITILDFRAHGNSVMKGPPFDIIWEDFTKDIFAVIDKVKIGHGERFIGVGLSKGAVALSIAEIQRPGTFSGLVLMEPIIVPTEGIDKGNMFSLEKENNNKLAIAAEARRSTFPSFETALDYFSKKGMTKTWEKRSIDAYTRGILKQTHSGNWELKCHPKAEACTYITAAIYRNTWDLLPQIRTHVTLLSGYDSTTYNHGSLLRLSKRFSNSKIIECEEIKATGHFMPMENPNRVSQSISNMISVLKRSRF